MHPGLCALSSHACTYCSRSGNFFVSIPWTLLSNFHFVHHWQILHCFKFTTKYRSVHAPLCALHSHACTYCLRNPKIAVSIHWTLLSNFNFLQHLQIRHCFKAITKYGNMHAHLCALYSHACTYCSRSGKIFVSIHWTLLSNFYFLHHPQFLHRLKAITKYRNVLAHLRLLCACA